MDSTEYEKLTYDVANRISGVSPLTTTRLDRNVPASRCHVVHAYD